MARIDELCSINMGQSPESSSYNEVGDGIPFFQGNADFGELHPRVRVWCNDPIKIANAGDILISVRAPIGALNVANVRCCIGRGLAALTVDERICEKDYFWHALACKVDELNSKGTGSTFKAINKNTLAETDIPIPSFVEQKQIANVLNKIVSLISFRKQQISKLDELVKSRFVEMFGDPVNNPKGWPTKPLMETGSCKNGMNFSSNDNGVEMHCLGVGNFKDLSVISDTRNLPTVSLNEIPSTEYLLQDGDIVFVRSNGNKTLVGRCLAIYPHDVITTFSGFCIRYRKKCDSLRTEYLLQVFKTPTIRQKIVGRGVNIQNLNQEILSQLNIPVPPLALQENFASFVQQVDKSKSEINKSLEKLETLKKALMQQYFG